MRRVCAGYARPVVSRGSQEPARRQVRMAHGGVYGARGWHRYLGAAVHCTAAHRYLGAAVHARREVRGER